MKIHYVMHASFETPGFIDHGATDRGHHYSGTHIYKGQSLPDAQDIDLLIMMGGPQSPLQMGEFGYLRDEISLVAKVIEQRKPVIGFCLGSQLIAEALGAGTRRSPEKEVGTFPVQLTLEGTRDPILRDFPSEFDVLHRDDCAWPWNARLNFAQLIRYRHLAGPTCELVDSLPRDGAGE
jgi:GMP synthase (glutamine-hydrolysing)